MIFLFVLLFLETYQKFTAYQNQKLNRVSNPFISSQGDKLFYAIQIWDPITSQIGQYIQSMDLLSNVTTNITNLEFGVQDQNPVQSLFYQNYLFYISNKSGKNQIWYTKFENDFKPQQLTNYSIKIDNMKISKQSKHIYFTLQIFQDCENLNCSFQKEIEIQNRGKNSWQLYDKLYIRNKDSWLNGKVNHIFKLNIEKIFQESNFEIIDIQQNIDKDCLINSEYIDYDISGDNVVFTHLNNTFQNQIIEYSNGTLNQISYQTQNKNPKYSPNMKKIAYLCKFQSIQYRICIFDKISNQIDLGLNFFDQQIDDFDWIDDQTIIFISIVKLTKQLFQFNIFDRANSLKVIFQDNIISANIPFNIPQKNYSIMVANSFIKPDAFYIFRNQQLEILIDFNSQLNFQMSQPEEFSFFNNNDTIYGWIFKPINFNDNLKYPLIYLINAGTESTWVSNWSFQINPQIFTNDGFTVAIINAHGSQGQGQKFSEISINDLVGMSYQDIIQGYYNLRRYDWIDIHKSCAIGSNQGGFMINWIQGNTDAFQCLISIGGIFNTLNYIYENDQIYQSMNQFCPLNQTNCFPFENKQNYQKFSPEKLVQKFKTPQLVVHGNNDFNIPITEGISMFNALNIMNVPSKFLVFDEENSQILKPENNIKLFDEIFQWTHQYTNRSKYNPGKPHQKILATI